MDTSQLPLSILIVCAVLGLAGVFASHRWTRILLWVLAMPPFGLGVVCLFLCWRAGGFHMDLIMLFCLGLFLPLIGCVIGNYTTRMHVPVSLFSELYLAYGDAAVSYDTAPGLFPDRVEYKWISTSELYKLWTIIYQARKETPDFPDFPCLLSKEVSKRFIYRFPHELVTDLSRITNARIPSLSKKWQEGVGGGWKTGKYRRLLTDLVRLSRQAIENGQRLYLWTCETSGKEPHRRKFLEKTE